MNTKLKALASVALLAIHSAACPLHVDHSIELPLNNTRRSVTQDWSRTAIKDVFVFDGYRFTTPQTVCIDGGYITSLGRCDDAHLVVNGTGQFLIPGLIENHVHLTDVQSLENLTSYGVTTVMHMNCGNYDQCKMMANQKGLADFLFAGRSAVGNGSLHSQQDPTRPRDTLIYPNTNVTQFVEWQFNNGSNFHKITAEIYGPSTEQQIEMVRTAHEYYHKQTMTHASSVDAYHQAVESRTDGIQHVPDDGIIPDNLIKKILSRNQFVTPTINIFEYAYTDPILQKFFDVQPGSNRTLSHAETNARNLYLAGVPLVTGTDSVGTLTMNGTSVTIPFGLTVHYEMQHFVEIVGMSPAEAINAATREAAKWHRIPDRGSIQVGKKADLVILGSNPLINITNTRDIKRMWASGYAVTDVAT